MRAALVGLICLTACGAALAQNAPTPATPGPNPGQSATDAITSPSKPPAEISTDKVGPAPAPGTPLPSSGSGATPGPSPDTKRPDGRQGMNDAPATTGQVQYTAPRAAAAQAEMSPTGPSAGEAGMRELVEAMRATAKATREGVDYGRVVPDILTQILAKLDKIEDKLDRIDTNAKNASVRRR